MKRRILAMLMLAVLAVSLFSACGEKKPAGTADTPEEQLTATVTLGHTMDEKLLAEVNNLIAEFNTLYPGIQVELQEVSGGITDENRPNVLFCYPDEMPGYQARGDLMALDMWIDSDSTVARADGLLEVLGLSDEQKNAMIESYYNEGKLGEETYMLPLYRQTLVLYYNRTFFEEAEIGLPYMWEDLATVCAQIKERDPESIPLVCNEEADLFISLSASSGGAYTAAEGEHYLFNNEENRAFVKQLGDWYQQGYLTTAGISGAEGSLVSKEGVPRSYMVIASSADTEAQTPLLSDGAYSYELGVLWLPQPGEGDQQVIARGPGLCVCKGDSDEEMMASWLLVKYLTANIVSQSKLARTCGYMPVMSSVYVNEEYSDFLDTADGGENVKGLTALVCMEQESAYFAVPAFDGAAFAREQVGALLNQCLVMTGDDVDGQIQAAFAQAVEACENNG